MAVSVSVVDRTQSDYVAAAVAAVRYSELLRNVPLRASVLEAACRRISGCGSFVCLASEYVQRWVLKKQIKTKNAKKYKNHHYAQRFPV